MSPFDYFSVRDPLHELRVRQARHHLARWGVPDAGRHAAADLERTGLRRMRDALEDLIILGPSASEWIPEVRTFHRRHEGQRWGLDVLALTSMGAPEGLALLNEGLRSPMNPSAYFPHTSSENLLRAFSEPEIFEAMNQLQQSDPRYQVRSSANFFLNHVTHKHYYDYRPVGPPACFSEYSHDSELVRVKWDQRALTLQRFPSRKDTSGPCDHAPHAKKDWSNHVEILGECALFSGGSIQPGRAAVYPRDRASYTLLEDEFPRSVLNWNNSAWIVSATTHGGWGSGGLLRVDRDQSGYLRITEHIDLGGAPLGYAIDHDGSLVVLTNRILVLGSHCPQDQREGLELLRVYPDLRIASVR